MGLTYKDFDESRLCPFGANILKKILQNSGRRIRFNFMIFTPEHCSTLASSGTKTVITLAFCEFQDEGAAFVEASAARQDETSGPAKLRFTANNPFNDRNWALFLNQHKLESLDLNEIVMSEVSCRAVATAEVRSLKFQFSALEDAGAALAESVRQGPGPKELFLRGLPFRSSESLVTFMNALKGDEHLERLRIPVSHDRQETRALAAALRENKGLVHLTVYFDEGVCTKSDITELLESISLHPSLRSLDLNRHRRGIDPTKRREFTKAVADMLSVNERVEAVSFHDDIFDKDHWDAYVAPRLECNLYRKWLPSILRIEEASTRAAVLARTLATFSSKSHLVWMLLSQNHDIVSSYLDSAHDPNSIPSRKRSRSSSLDGMIAH
jgi:hypothetical protein